MNAVFNFLELNDNTREGFSLIDTTDVDAVYAWLYEEENKYLPERMDRLIQCLRELLHLRISTQQRYRLTEAFISSVLQIKQELSHASIGSFEEPYTRRRMIALCHHAAGVYFHIVQHAVVIVYDISFLSARPRIQMLGPYTGFPIHRALEFMTFSYYESQRWRVALPDGFWSQAHRLFHLAYTQNQHPFRVNSIRLMSGPDLSIQQLYSRLLLLSQCGMSRLNLLSMGPVYNFCTQACGQLFLSSKPNSNECWMIDPDLDISFALYHPRKKKKDCYYLSFEAVRQLAQNDRQIRHHFTNDRLTYLAERYSKKIVKERLNSLS